MKTLLMMMPLIFGCAYGVSNDQPIYGHGQPPGSQPDNGESDQGLNVDPETNLPYGCAAESISISGQLPMSFVVCNADPTRKWKDLVDPGPDSKLLLGKEFVK